MRVNDETIDCICSQPLNPSSHRLLVHVLSLSSLSLFSLSSLSLSLSLSLSPSLSVSIVVHFLTLFHSRSPPFTPLMVRSTEKNARIRSNAMCIMHKRTTERNLDAETQ